MTKRSRSPAPRGTPPPSPPGEPPTALVVPPPSPPGEPPGEATHRLFVGNLSFQTRSEDLQDYFSEFGKVESATVIMNRDNPGTPLETNNLMLC